MWMSDKPRNQQQLARDLASLIHVLPSATVIPFLTAFWQTMANEWNGIDVLRMDKFLYLTRMYLLESLKWYKKQKWGGVQDYMDVLEQIPLNPTELRIPNGLRYHVIDIYVDEMEKVDEDAESMPVESLLRPMRRLVKESLTKSIRERVKIQLEDERIGKWLGGEEGEEGIGKKAEQAEDDEWGGIED
jgi:ribosomal RNA-processing protein 1